MARLETFNLKIEWGFLESNGYANIKGLQRELVIEVDGYDEKEKLIHDIFSKSRIAGTELFALDI